MTTSEEIKAIRERAKGILPELLNCGIEDYEEAEAEPYFTKEVYDEGRLSGTLVLVPGEGPSVATFHEDGDSIGISRATANAFCKAGAVIRELLSALDEATREAGEEAFGPTDAAIQAIRERVKDPDPDGVMDIEGLYDDASSDRAVLLSALDEAVRERDAHDRASEAMRLNLQTRISERDIRTGELEAERDALRAGRDRLRKERDDAVAGWGLTAVLQGEVERVRRERDDNAETGRNALKAAVDAHQIILSRAEAERDALEARCERLRGVVREMLIADENGEAWCAKNGHPRLMERWAHARAVLKESLDGR